MTASVVAGGKKRTYLMVDITPDDDCRGVEKLLKSYGWVNLVRKLLPLKKAGTDDFRDDAHPDLPIRNGTIEPAGKIVKATTKTDGWVDEISTLDYDIVEKNMEFMRRYLWKPGVIGDLAAKKGQLEDPKKSVISGTPEYPDLLFLSSHGYPHGRFQQHYKRVAEPEHDEDYHVVFECPELDAGIGWGANSVKWIVFAACNALRPELAYRWAQAMRKPSGPRGILGFYSISPGPGGTITYMTSLFQSSKPLVDAWGKANPGNPWAALVFEEARKDTFAEFTKNGYGPPSNSAGKILYFHKTEAPDGIDVEDLNPKKMLNCGLYRNEANKYKAVSEAEGLAVGRTYTAVCQPPSMTRAWPSDMAAIEVSLVNLRENWWEGGKNSPDWQKMGASDIVNNLGQDRPIAASDLKTKFCKKGIPDTVRIPKQLVQGKWVGVQFTIPAEAYKYFYGEMAKIWVKFEAVDAAGKKVANGTTIDWGLMPIRRAAAAVAVR
jgi:hypothetical protein